MTDLYDYTVAEVLQLEAAEARKYYSLAQTLKAKNILKLEPLRSKPYGYIKTLQTSTTYNEPEMLAKLQQGREPSEREVLAVINMRFIDYGHQWRHIAAELEQLTAKEATALHSEPSINEQAAGVDQLERFGVFGVIDTLAGGDVLKYKDIEAQPYSVIFAKLYLEKERAEYRERYAAVLKSKNKH